MINLFNISFLKILITASLILTASLTDRPQSAWANGPVKVGIFQNKPIVYFEGRPKGLFVEILNHVAEKENWQLEYVTCELEDCLNLLKSNQLDLMTSLGESPARLERFIFSKESIWTFWGTVYAVDIKINGILDLKNKTIGVRRKNKITSALEKILVEFHIPVTYVAFDNYESAFEALQDHKIDAVAVNNTYAFDQQKDNSFLRETPIVFSPFSAYFAASKNGGDPGLLSKIDEYVKELKSDKSSIYHAFRRNWFGPTDTYWTGNKIGMMGAILFLVTGGAMAFWRYRSLVGLNKELAKNLAQRMQIEESLRASEHFVRSILDGLSSHIAILNESGEIETVNDAWRSFADVNGPVRGNVLEGSNYLQACMSGDGPDADTARNFARGIRDVLAGRRHEFSAEYICHSSDEQRWFIGRVTRFQGDGPPKAVVAHENITKLKLAGEALRKQERDHAEAQRIAHLGHWELDAAENKLIWSDEVFRIFEIAKKDFGDTYEAFFEMVHPEDRDQVDQAYKESVKARKPFDIVHRRMFSDGSIKYVHQRGRNEYDENGNLLRSMGTAQDVTMLKETEIEKEKIEEHLRQTQKLEAIGTLAGGIAHDFNNILSSIVGYAEIARIHEVPEGHPAQQSLEQITKGAQRATDLVQQILTFSRRREQAFIPMDVQPIIKEAVKMLRASLPATMTISLDLKAVPSTIMGEPSRFHQVLINLCTNAAHAMRTKGGDLKVQTRNLKIRLDSTADFSELKPGTYLQLNISDTGGGMLPGIRDRIFEPYFTTKPVGEGTGLGLAVVHGIIKDFAGHISVTSNPDKGSIFTILLPTVKQTPEKDQPTPKKSPRGTERILLVDDEPALTVLGRRLLSKLGYSVTTDNSSASALDQFEAAPRDFDLVISDLTMPGLTGDQLAQKILKIRPGLPIILCTGFSEAITSEEAKAVGISALLMKPLVPSELARKIREVLDGKA